MINFNLCDMEKVSRYLFLFFCAVFIALVIFGISFFNWWCLPSILLDLCCIGLSSIIYNYEVTKPLYR